MRVAWDMWFMMCMAYDVCDVWCVLIVVRLNCDVYEFGVVAHGAWELLCALHTMVMAYDVYDIWCVDWLGLWDWCVRRMGGMDYELPEFGIGMTYVYDLGRAWLMVCVWLNVCMTQYGWIVGIDGIDVYDVGAVWIRNCVNWNWYWLLCVWLRMRMTQDVWIGGSCVNYVYDLGAAWIGKCMQRVWYELWCVRLRTCMNSDVYGVGCVWLRMCGFVGLAGLMCANPVQYWLGRVYVGIDVV